MWLHIYIFLFKIINFRQGKLSDEERKQKAELILFDLMKKFNLDEDIWLTFFLLKYKIEKYIYFFYKNKTNNLILFWQKKKKYIYSTIVKFYIFYKLIKNLETNLL